MQNIELIQIQICIKLQDDILDFEVFLEQLGDAALLEHRDDLLGDVVLLEQVVHDAEVGLDEGHELRLLWVHLDVADELIAPEVVEKRQVQAAIGRVEAQAMERVRRAPQRVHEV